MGNEMDRALLDGTRFGGLLRAFKSGEAFGDALAVEKRNAGTLVVTSNQIVACDPYGLGFGVSAFERRVPRGKFPVQLSVAHVLRGRKKGEERIAAAMVQLGRAKPVGFKRAESSELSDGTLLGGSYQGYPVDSGTGCFADGRAAELLDKACKKAHGAGELDPLAKRTLREKLAKNFAPRRSWAAMRVDRSSGANVVAFSAGWGDGVFPSYWGYDADRKLVALITDFLVLPTRSELCKEAWGGQSWRQFNYEGDRADKFWRIKVKGKKQVVHQGLVGDEGDKREQEFKTSDAAMQSAVRKIRRQTELGFYEITLTSSRIRAAKKRLAKKTKQKKASSGKAKASSGKAKKASGKTKASSGKTKKTSARKKAIKAPAPRRRRFR